jgi:hypothetical protein
MAFDEGLAERVREQLQELTAFDEKRMFGGLCFLVNGNMACGLVGDTLMARVDKQQWPDLLQQDHVREMDFTGRSLKGFLYVDPAGIAEDGDLAFWLEKTVKFAGSLPPK